MIINLVYDQVDGALPAGFKSTINSVVQFFEARFADPITITIDVGFGEVNGSPITSSLSASALSVQLSSFNAIEAALAGDSSTTDDASFVGHLPGTDPTGGGLFSITSAQAIALGLSSGGGVDGSIGFSNTADFDYDRTDGIASGQYDFFGIVAHEISVVLGRNFGIGDTILDLARHSAPGTLQNVGTYGGYFSLDGGTTNVMDFNAGPGNQRSDWTSSIVNDAFSATPATGQLLQISEADLRLIDALGYNRVAAPQIAKRADFNGDGIGDLLWQNDSGQAAVWEMNGLNVVSGGFVGGTPSAGWKVIGSGDFDGDGKSDILWQNTSTGQAAVWEMNGLNVTDGNIVGGTPSAGWKVIGSGDFDGDGKSDILWQNTTTGQAAVWEMSGLNVTNGNIVGGTPSAGWKVIGSGDFDGDGKSDILWQNTSTGQAAVWLMNGLNVTNGNIVGGTPSAGWNAIGSGDFDGDGMSDILWQNTTTGQAAVWLMNGLNVTNGNIVGGTPSAGWNVVGAADANGDGKSDIQWQNTNGQAAVWLMSGLNVTGGNIVGGNPGPTWHLIAPSG